MHCAVCGKNAERTAERAPQKGNAMSEAKRASQADDAMSTAENARAKAQERGAKRTAARSDAESKRGYNIEGKPCRRRREKRARTKN